MSARLRTLAITAHHESAHAVMAIDAGRPFADVTINLDGSGALGRIRYHNDGFDTFLAFDELAIVTLAGGHGQRRFAPKSRWRFESRSDRAIVHARIKKDLGLAGRRAAEKFAELDAKAEQAVADNWPDIVKVAGALLERHTLTKDDVRAVLGRSPMQRRFANEPSAASANSRPHTPPSMNDDPHKEGVPIFLQTQNRGAA